MCHIGTSNYHSGLAVNKMNPISIIAAEFLKKSLAPFTGIKF